MNNRFLLEVGELYKFDRKTNDVGLILYRTQEHVMLDLLKNAVDTTNGIHGKTFTVISNVKHPYDNWERNTSIVGILLDNKILHFKMPNGKRTIYDFGIERVYDVELSIKELASLFSSDE